MPDSHGDSREYPLMPSFFHKHEWYGDWLPNRSREMPGGAVYCLPKAVDDGIRALYSLTAAEEQAENDFRAWCISHAESIGFWNDRLVSYPSLKPVPRLLSTDSLGDVSNFGWEQQHVEGAISGSLKVNELASRVPSIAGRLLTTPDFLHERDILRDQWMQIPAANRLGLPLTRRLGDAVRVTRPELFTAALLQFSRAFDAFCDRWDISEFMTWDLPQAYGPNWLARLSGEPSTVASSRGRTPIRFPISARDELNEAERAEHVQLLEEYGIDDINRWETYERLLQIDHWDRVLTERYLDRKQPRNRVTRRIYIIAEHLGLDGERITKLRKLLSALKGGRRQSLRGYR